MSDLESLFDSVTTPAVELPYLRPPGLLVDSQVFPDGGGVKSQDLPGF